MRLNADILYENINDSIPAEMTGHHTAGHSLRRPEFFLDSAEPMQADHLYILPGDQFPRHLNSRKAPSSSVPAARPWPSTTLTGAASSV